MNRNLADTVDVRATGRLSLPLAMTNLALDAVQCRLMSDVVSRMNYDARLVFWKILPDIIPDLTAHMPALGAAVRNMGHEDAWVALEMLSSYPLPTILSPEMVIWRSELVAAWEKQLKAARKAVDDVRTYWAWTHEYRYSLRGLAKVDGCGMAMDTTCPSVLPTLLSEARYIKKRVAASAPSVYRSFGQLLCLAALADWRPAPNVMTAPDVMHEWAVFWLELYENGSMDDLYNEPNDPIIMKGIAAKALLNLLEARGKEEAGVPVDMEPLLLESLMMAVDIAGNIEEDRYPHSLLNWKPQDMTRFPIHRLAMLAETMLKRFKFSCRKPVRWTVIWGWNEAQGVDALHTALEELIRWEDVGLLTACGIDLFPQVVTDVSYYLNYHMYRDDLCANLAIHKLHRCVIREDVAVVKEGKELLQKLEGYWWAGCKHENPMIRLIAWNGRMQLQRAGLGTVTPLAFHKEVMRAIKKEQSPAVRLVLSFWRPEKDMPDRVWRTWASRWQEGLKSDNDGISRTAALSFLTPNPSDAPVTRWQKLRDVLQVLPEEHRPKLSIAEVTHLMAMVGGLPLGGPNTGPNVNPNRTWHFRADEMRFHLITDHAGRRSDLSGTRMTAGAGRPDMAV